MSIQNQSPEIYLPPGVVWTDDSGQVYVGPPQQDQTPSKPERRRPSAWSVVKGAAWLAFSGVVLYSGSTLMEEFRNGCEQQPICKFIKPMVGFADTPITRAISDANSAVRDQLNGEGR